MYTTQFKVHSQVFQIRETMQLFKRNVLKYLEKLEISLEKFFVDLYRENLNDNSEQIINEQQFENIDDNVSSLINAWDQNGGDSKEDQYLTKFSQNLITMMKSTLTRWDSAISELLNYQEKNYAFHEKFKFPSIQISEKFNIEQTQSQTHYCFALINQQLNPILQSTIQFKFPKLVGDMGVGICDLAIMKENTFRLQLNQTGNGAFVCFQDTYTINTEQKDLNWKTKGFRFGEQDVIEVSYDPIEKKVTWKKVNVIINLNSKKPNEGYSSILLNEKRELYFCVIVKSQGARVAVVLNN